jgi:hypothetical protein
VARLSRRERDKLREALRVAPRLTDRVRNLLF